MGDWQCSACTFINKMTITMCEICGTESPKKKKTNPHMLTLQIPKESELSSYQNNHCPITDYDADNEMVWKRKNMELESRDWRCTACHFQNDWHLTKHMDIPCCLQCGAPNIDDEIPPLQDMRDCTVKCRECGTIK